jgi:hypothetical protein
MVSLAGPRNVGAIDPKAEDVACAGRDGRRVVRAQASGAGWLRLLLQWRDLCDGRNCAQRFDSSQVSSGHLGRDRPGRPT